MDKKSEKRVRYIAFTALFGALAAVLMFISVSVPFMPSFIKFDVSELPALIASFAFGPVSGVAVCLIKNVINLSFTTTSGVGELCNFLLGCAFVLPAGLIYKFNRTRRAAVWASFAGAFAMAVISIPVNYFISYPFYYNFMPEEAILEAYKAIFPQINSILQALCLTNAPFTLLKGLVSVIITLIVYKSLSPLLKGKN